MLVHAAHHRAHSIVLEGDPSLLVGGEVDREPHPLPSHLTYDRMWVEKLLEGLEQVLAVPARLVYETVSLFDCDGRVCRRGRAGVPAKRVDVPENRERVDQLWPGDHSTHRHVAGREGFRHRHDVRFDSVVFACEPRSGTTESRDHFIDDQQNAIAVADLANAS